MKFEDYVMVEENKIIELINSLKKVKNLESVFLKNVRMYDLVASSFQELFETNKKIKEFFLFSVPVTENQLQKICGGIKNSSSIQTVFLIGNNIGDQGAFFISDLIKSNPSFKSLCVSENDIHDLGIFSICDSLSFHSSLDSFDISFNYPSVKGVQHISSMLSNNKTITELLTFF